MNDLAAFVLFCVCWVLLAWTTSRAREWLSGLLLRQQ
jgi:hypothetical protein